MPIKREHDSFTRVGLTITCIRVIDFKTIYSLKSATIRGDGIWQNIGGKHDSSLEPLNFPSTTSLLVYRVWLREECS